MGAGQRDAATGTGRAAGAPLRRRARRLAAALAIAALAAGAIELGARVIYAVQLDEPRYLSYPRGVPAAPETIAIGVQSGPGRERGRLEPGEHPLYVDGVVQHTMTINASGFRGRDLASPREARYRVVSLGGSSTFASECPDGETYPEQLERLLDEAGGEDTAEVFNMGMVGHDATEIGRLFAGEVLAGDPDVVTVCSAFNDAFNAHVLDVRPGIGAWHTRALWGRSLFYTALYNRALARRHEREPWSAARARYRAALEELAGLAARRGVAAVFIAQPMVSLDRMDPDVLRERLERRGAGELERVQRSVDRSAARQDELVEVMRDVAQRRGAAWIDPRPALEDAPHPERYFFAFLHLTPEGSARMAEEIHTQLVRDHGGLEGLAGPGGGGR